MAETYTVLLFIEHKWGNGMALIGAVTDLAMDPNGSTTNAKLIGKTRDSTEGGRHLNKASDDSRK